MIWFTWVAVVGWLVVIALRQDARNRRLLETLRVETALASFRQRQLDRTPWLN